MANYFYVKSGGTRAVSADTPFTTEQADSFANIGAANYYDTIGDAVNSAKTNEPTDGDFILVSDAHAKVYDNTVDVTLNVNGSRTGAGLVVVSVLDTNSSVYSPGASENLSDTVDDFRVSGNGIVAGVDLESGDDVLFFNTDGEWVFQDLAIKPDGNLDMGLRLSNEGASARLVNVTIDPNAVNAVPILIEDGATLIWEGGSVGATGANFLIHGDNVRSGVIRISGVDLSTVDAIYDGANAGADSVLIQLYNCELKVGATLYSALNRISQRFEMFNCDDATGDAFHRFLVASGAGKASNNDVTYVTATQSWYEGSIKSSIEVVTETLCNHANPLVFELPAQNVDLSDAAKDTITIDLVTDLVLTDTDIAAFLVYPDGTTAVTPRTVTSGGSASGFIGNDPLGAGTTLATSALGAADWTSEPVSPNFYELVLDTSGVAGQAAAIGVRIEVYRTIAAGKLFIHPLMTVSAT